MELIFTNKAGTDIGIVELLDGDFAFGADENDFSLTLKGATPEIGAFLYQEGSDLGGIVTGYESDGAGSALTVNGHTWTGVLDRKVLSPDSGSAYLTLSGDVRDICAMIINRLGLVSLFRVDTHPTGIVTTHTFQRVNDGVSSGDGRYMGGWAAMWQLLTATGCKVRMRWDAETRRVVLYVSQAGDYTDEESVSAGLSAISISTDQPTNHLVCLGQGELADRTVRHVYLDAEGNASTTQTFYGLDEIAEVYDDTSAETATTLISNGRKKLLELYADSQEVTIESRKGAEFDLGDVIGGTDVRSGLYAKAVVTKKVAEVWNGIAVHKYSSTIRR